MDILEISDDKRNFVSLQKEAEHLKNGYIQEKERTESFDEDLTEKYHEANEEVKVLKEKLIEVETKYEQELERLKLENEDLSKKFGYFG